MPTLLKKTIDKLMSDEYMSEKQKTAFKAYLKRKQSELSEQIELNNKELLLLATHSSDDVDKANETINSKLIVNEITTKKERYKEATRSLNLIKQDRYGYCLACDEDIGLARMLAIPTALRDIECETLYVKKNKTIIHPQIK